METRAYMAQLFFYTDDFQQRNISPLYTVDVAYMPGIIDELWDCFYNDVLPVDKRIKTSPYQHIQIGVTTGNYEIDDERNKKLEELEKLPKTLYFSYESPFGETKPREEQ